MGNFVAMNSLQQLRRLRIARRRKAAREVLREIKVRLLKGQAQSRHVIRWALHPRHRAPEVAAHRTLAELDPARRHARQIQPRVLLLVLQRLQHAAPECRRGLGKTQEHERHQFRGEQLVIGEEVQKQSARAFRVQLMQAGEIRLAGLLLLELQPVGTARHFRREQRGTRMRVGDDAGPQEFFLQRGREQDSLRKSTKFHDAGRTLPQMKTAGESKPPVGWD